MQATHTQPRPAPHDRLGNLYGLTTDAPIRYVRVFVVDRQGAATITAEPRGLRAGTIGGTP
jgi:hypothetical protein